MSDMQARLVLQRGPNPGTTYVLNHDQIVIGRSDSNGIVLIDPEISRQHAQLIRQEDGGYAVQDLGSTNGSFVNSQRVEGLVKLEQGDVVSFGETVTLIYWDEWTTDSNPVAIPLPERGPQSPETAVPPLSKPASSPVIQHVSVPSSQWESAPELPPLPDEDYVAETAAKRRQRWLIGCGAALLLLLCLCMASLFFLDGYQQGRLLYCGVLRPFWQFILGPFGFNPACL